MKRLFPILLVLAFPALADSRTWTDASGKHKSTGELADYQGSKAYLRKDDGSIVAVPLLKLSKTDQDFIKSTTKAVKVIEGKVVSIADGDTLTVLNGKDQVKIRLEGIDSPERYQAYGTKAREALAAKVFQKTIRVEWRELDKYGRTLGHVFVDDRWVNKEMVEEGWAWHFRKYSKSDVLADAESDARTAKAGLWADAAPVAPWDFRHPPTATGSDETAKGLLSIPDKPKETPKETDDTPDPFVSKAPVVPKARAVTPPPPSTVERNPNGEVSTGSTATGIPTYTGPRGGQYHYSKSGKKVYERRKK